MDRRTFLTALGAAGVTAATGSRLLAADAKPALKVGLIGCGWYGLRNLETLSRAAAVETISLCDVNTHSLADGLKIVAKYQHGVPRTFSDYREMLATQRHDIVIVGTPDHWHALPAIAAMKAGADIWLEKPIGVDVIEGEAMVAAARKYGRVVQVNTQRRSTPHLAQARQRYLHSAKLGTIGLVETYSYFHGRLAEVVLDLPAPRHLDYEFWSGPAPLTPFQAVKEYRGWRNFMDYGNGMIGDVGVHMVDAARWMLGLGWPTSIRSTGGIYVDKHSSADITDTQQAIFSYPDLELNWRHRSWGPPPWPQHHWTDLWGMRFFGSNGTLRVTLAGYEFTPAEGPVEGFSLLSPDRTLANIDYNSPLDVTAEAETRHCLDFLQARETRSRPVADIGEGHVSTAMCEIANLALKLGRPLAYDPATRTIAGDDEATKLLARPYRGPWKHPTPEDV